MDKDWVIGLGFGLGALCVLGWLWREFCNAPLIFDDEEYDKWNDER